MTVWILTIMLIGTTIEFQEGPPNHTLRACMDEGHRVVRDYQLGGIRAKFECEERVLPPDMEQL
jgi:hypothetical protein